MENPSNYYKKSVLSFHLFNNEALGSILLRGWFLELGQPQKALNRLKDSQLFYWNVFNRKKLLLKISERLMVYSRFLLFHLPSVMKRNIYKL